MGDMIVEIMASLSRGIGVFSNESVVWIVVGVILGIIDVEIDLSSPTDSEGLFIIFVIICSKNDTTCVSSFFSFKLHFKIFPSELHELVSKPVLFLILSIVLLLNIYEIFWLIKSKAPVILRSLFIKILFIDKEVKLVQFLKALTIDWSPSTLKEDKSNCFNE